MRHGCWRSALWLAQREPPGSAARRNRCVTRLAHIQDAFQRFLVQGDPAIESDIVGTQRVPVATRLGIYGDGYRSRLIEALQATYPVLANLLGEADFHTLGTAYVGAHESSFSSIRFYGDRLAQFLAAHADYSEVPLLAELASWEWAMAAAFDAADVSALEVTAFAQLPPQDWARLCFEWSPSVHVLKLEWNVPELWKAVTEDTERPDPNLAAPPVSSACCYARIWRSARLRCAPPRSCAAGCSRA
jgi:hypothetical protein